MSKNRHIWKTHGLTSKGELLADKAMPYVLEAVKLLPEDLARFVFEEAMFQVHILPLRSPKFRKKMTWYAPVNRELKSK